MEAFYAFGVTIRMEPDAEDVTLEPPTVQRRCLLRAPEPGTDGWLDFRELCWRGEVADEAHVRRLLSEKLGQPVETVDFRAFHVDEAYREAFERAVADCLEAFKADSVTEVVSKYFGSSLEVRTAES